MTVCTDADIVTTTLLAGDDELARRLVELKNSKNAYEDSLAELELKMDPAEIGEGFKQQKQALDLKTKSVDLQIRQIINYKILTGDKKAGAYQKLANEMIKQGRNAGATISLLNKLDASTPMDLESVAKYFMQEGEDVTSAVKRINDNIANVGTAIAEQEKYINSIPTISDAIKQKKTKEEIKKLIQDRAKEDKKNIKEGLTPNNFADPNDEWTVIKNTTDDIDEQYRLWGQYVLGNAIIGKADAGTLRAIKAVYETKDSVGKLTADQIFKIESLDELMARAYTNVNDLVEDGMLRDAFSEKLTQLTAGYKVGSEKRISRQEVDLEYAERLINLNRLAGDGVAFTSIVRHDAVGEAARKMGIKVDNSSRFYKALVDTLKEDTYLDNMTKEGYVKLIDGTQLTVGNMLELVYVATGDRTLPRLLREKTFDEKSILDIGTQVLLGNKTEASRKVLKLINKVKELPSLADSRDLALMTLTGKKVQPNAPKAFFNYRQMYDQSDMLKETKLKADFMDRMANANRAEVDIDGLEDISSSKGDALVKKLKQFEGGYVLVNDSGWLNNAEFKDALNKANEEIKDESKKIQVLYPRQAQMSNFTMDNGKLIFRSIDGQAYRDMMDNISMRTLGEAGATRTLKSLAYEVETGSNGDKIRYMVSRKYSPEEYAHLASKSGQKDADGNSLSYGQVNRNKDSYARVDEDLDKPLKVLYHGSPGFFDMFKSSRGKVRTGLWFDTIFLSDNKNIAGTYASEKGVISYEKLKDMILESFFENIGWEGEKKYFQKMSKDEVSQVFLKMYETIHPNTTYELVKNDAWNYTINKIVKKREDGGEAITKEVVYEGNTDEMKKYLTDKMETGAKNYLIEKDEGVVYSGYANIKNPYIVDAGGRNWSNIMSFSKLAGSDGGFEFYYKFSDYDKKKLKEAYADWAKQTDNINNGRDFVQFVIDGRYIPEVMSYQDAVGKIVRRLPYEFQGYADQELHHIVRDGFSDSTIDDVTEMTAAVMVGNVENNYYIDDFIDWLGEYGNGNPYLQENLLDIEEDYVSTNGLVAYVKFLNEKGLGNYDGIIIKNVNDFGRKIEGDTLGTDYIVFDSNQFKSIDNKVPTSAKDINLERVIDGEGDDVAAEIALRVKLFKDNRTVEDIAKAYGVQVETVKKIVTEEGLEAYGCYGDGLIEIAKIAKESTGAHELFHAIFDIVDKETKNNIIETSKKLFGYTEDEANEELAKAFSEWFRTGEFKYSNISKLSKKEQNSFFKKVKDFFDKIKKLWIDEVETHKNEVEQMFNDMMDLKWQPNDGSAVSKVKAAGELTDYLEESANAYFASMLGKPDWANPNYRDTLHGILEDTTGIPIKSLRDLAGVDKNKLWKAVDTEFTNAQKTVGKFRNEVTDITERLNTIDNYTLDELRDDVSDKLKGLINDSAFNDERAPLIKQALKNFDTATTVEEWMMAKGRLLSMANGGSAENFSLDELKSIFRNGSQATEYKAIFFPNQELDEKETAKYVKQINDMIFDGLTGTVAQNLVKMGYSLPLDNVRGVVFDYLIGNINMEDGFVKAFLYKNGLPTSKALMESVMDSVMPTNLMLGYEDELFKLTSKGEGAGYINRIVEQGNPFVPDTYSSLVSLMYAKAGNIADGNEAKYLTSLLDTYSNIVKERLKDGIDFKEAQQLKTELGYALDIFEQDILMPKYGKYLTPDKRAAIRNMKSYITIVVGKEGDGKSSKALKELLEANNRIYSTFTSALDDVLNKYNVVKRGLAGADDKVAQEEARKFKEKLKDDGAVVENVNGELVIVDAKEQLKDNLDTAPNTIKGLGLVETVDGGIDSLDNNSAYYLNQLVESAKKLDALAKWETSIMYTMDPELNSYRFFNAFRLVDDGGERVPMALVGDILSGNPNLAKYNTMGLNNILKKDIFNGIKSKFAKDGAVSLDELKEIISKTLEENTTSIKQVFNDITKESKYNEVLDEITNQFKKAFMPYTHLKDIPSTSLDGITDVRGRINNALEEQIEAIRESIDAMPDEYRNLLNEVEVTTPTGQTITIQQFLDGKRPNWKEAIFDDEDILVKTADEFGLKVSDSADAKEIEKIQKENIKHRRNLSNQYNEALQAIQNQQRITSEGERKLTSRMLNNSRSTARKFTLTNRLVEATDMVSGLEEEAARMMKAWLLGWKNIITFGRMNREEPLKRLAQVQEAYKRFYTMGLEGVENITPKNEAEEMAKHLCRYFKTIERHLGSADGATGVTTKANINRAFYNIGEVVNNIRSIEGLYALQSAIEQNQILKFFRFSEPGQASYVREFTRPASARTEDIFGGYREYVTKLPDNINVDTFNDIFASQFTDTEFKMLYQALSGITYVGGYGKPLNRFLNFVNGSNFIFRFLISYPGQLLTIPQQGIAYFLKQKGFERQLGIEDMSEIDRVRMQYGTLDKAYNEINLFRDTNPDDIASSSYYNRYGTPDISAAYKGAGLELTDDVNDMYGKMMDYQSSWDDMGRLQRSIDAYKDNANNIIDGLFSRNFKNIAFLKGIKENSFMQFGSAGAFEAFMKDNKISQAVKDQLMDAVNASAGRNFRNILGLGFGGLDRAIGGNGMSNIFYGLMQFFNFRGAWGQNIFRNMGETFKSAFKMLPMGTSKEGRNAIATYIATTPEFMNFVDILFNDMQWTWKMVRYQDNGRWSELDNEYDIWDFLEYSVELMNMTSQWWQGINSFGPARPILEAWGPEGSMFASLRNPEVYKDTYGVGAFFNSLGKNAGRNRKPINYAFQAIQALEEGGPEGVQAFLQNQFWKLSFGSLRYMMNEDANDYGFTYEYLPDESGIPSIIRGEGALGSIKSFSYDLSNNNTWTSIQQIFSDGGWDEKKTYLEDVWGGMINSSQAWSSIKNAIKATPYYNEIFSGLGLGNRKSPWSFDSFADVLEKTESGRELLETGKVNPKTIPQIKTFINQFIDEDGESSNRSAYKPFGENFAEAISNYNQLGHIKGDEAHSGDKETEFMLSQIRYERDSNGNFIEKNGKKVETQLWKNLIEYIKLHPTDMDATSIDVSKRIFKWVEDNNDDPNYLLYQSLIGQGMADMYLTNAWNDYQDAWNGLFGGKKAKDKLTKTEAQDSGWYWDNFMKYLSGTKVSGTDVNLVEYLQRLDRKAAMSSYIKMIKDELTDTKDIENIERYVTFYEDQYGNEKTKINSQYASQIEALGGIGDAIDKGNLEMMMGRASSFANTYLKDDETGLVKASAITSLINKIRDTDISPKLKLEMIAALGENHAEFLQTHLPDMIANLGEDAADALLGIVNDHIYEWDGAVNAAIGDAIINGDGDAAKKGSGTSSKFKSALAVTTKLKNGAGTSGNGYGGRTSTTSTAKWVPYTLNIAKLLDSTGGKGYSPKNPEINIRTYKPTIDLSIGKDVTRTTKAPKTQELKKKKVVL